VKRRSPLTSFGRGIWSPYARAGDGRHHLATTRGAPSEVRSIRGKGLPNGEWIRRTLNPATKVIIRAEPTGAVSRLKHLALTLEDMVCQECNNTWMSRLENQGQLGP
jgi:hypothetical protein